MNYNTIKDALLIAGVVISNHIWDFWIPLNVLQMGMAYVCIAMITWAVLAKTEDIFERKAERQDERTGI